MADSAVRVETTEITESGGHPPMTGFEPRRKVELPALVVLAAHR